MIRNLLAAIAAAVLLVNVAPTGVAAQEVSPRYFGAGWLAGPSYVTQLNTDAGEGVRELTPGAGLVVGLHVDRWIGPDGRFGFRVQGSYEQPRFDWAPGERKIDTAAGDLSVLIRFLTPEGEPAALPYLAGGLGVVWYDLGTGAETSFGDADAYHDGQSRTIPTGVVGLGVDIPLNWDWYRLPVQLRLEAADHIAWRSPLWSLADDSRYGAVHHLRFTIGLNSTVRRW